MHSNVAGGTELQHRTSEQWGTSVLQYKTPGMCQKTYDSNIDVKMQIIVTIISWICLTTYKQVLVQLNVHKN